MRHPFPSFVYVQRIAVRCFLFVLSLLVIPPAVSSAQVVVELNYGGTLEGHVVASDDSTITLEIPVDGERTRKAVLRRSDISIIEDHDAVAAPVRGHTADSITEESSSEYRYRNVLGGGLSFRGASGSGLSVANDTRLEFAYEFTVVPRTRDEENRTCISSGLTPTGYFSIVSTTDPYGKYPLRGTAESAFYGHKISPRVVVGGGIIYATHGIDNSFDINRQYILAGTADFFPLGSMRLRETLGAGWMTTDDGSLADSSGRTRVMIHAQHRLDHAVGDAYLLGATGYTHTLQCQYIESHGINLQFSNGIEFSPDRLYSIALFVPLYFDIPSQGDMEFAAGMGAELVLHPTERLTLRLGNQWRDGLGEYDIDARRTTVAVFWQF